VQLFPLSGSVAQLKLLPDPLSIPLPLGEWEQTKSTPLPAQTLIPVFPSHGFPKAGLAVQGAALPVSPLEGPPSPHSGSPEVRQAEFGGVLSHDVSPPMSRKLTMAIAKVSK
jgi:hypothetical protein